MSISFSENYFYRVDTDKMSGLCNISSGSSLLAKVHSMQRVKCMHYSKVISEFLCLFVAN